jgi:Fuc2NAc and GlcNAc transferase
LIKFQMLFISLVLLVAFAAAAIITGAVRAFVLSRPAVVGASSLFDIPNHRSSHINPTPRGGGVGIVLAFLLAASWLTLNRTLPFLIMVGLVGSSFIVAIVGFLDDWKIPLSSRHRLAVHFLAAVVFLLSTGGVPAFVAFGMVVDLGWVGNVLAAVYLVWLVNLFNFMDGVDGIAAVEAITVSLSGALLWWITTGSDGWMIPTVLAAAVAGFLCWNHPPAKIFMGDAGSYFLGMTLGALALWSGIESQQLFWSWSILLGCFVVDATTTLVRRVARGERFDEAHRSHVYQYAARRLMSHKRVTYYYGLVNILWLLPVAALVALKYLDGVLGLLIAYLPLVLVAIKLKAGAPAEVEELKSPSAQVTTPGIHSKSTSRVG